MKDAIAEARDAIYHEDYNSATRLLRPLADGGGAEAQFLMGYLFFTSADTSKEESRAWLELAAAQDHPDALHHLSHMGEEWDFGPPENERNRNLLMRAAELGWANAHRDLGCYYACGDGGFPKDSAQARVWYFRAAQQGHSEAQYDYGAMLFEGEGGVVDTHAGLEWVRRAAAQGEDCALHFLAQLPTENV
jgi:TPR repeat protein